MNAVTWRCGLRSGCPSLAGGPRATRPGDRRADAILPAGAGPRRPARTPCGGTIQPMAKRARGAHGRPGQRRPTQRTGPRPAARPAGDATAATSLPVAMLPDEGPAAVPSPDAGRAAAARARGRRPPSRRPPRRSTPTSRTTSAGSPSSAARCSRVLDRAVPAHRGPRASSTSDRNAERPPAGRPQHPPIGLSTGPTRPSTVTVRIHDRPGERPPLATTITEPSPSPIDAPAARLRGQPDAGRADGLALVDGRLRPPDRRGDRLVGRGRREPRRRVHDRPSSSPVTSAPPASTRRGYRRSRRTSPRLIDRTSGIVHIKVWAPDGTVLYSERPELRGQNLGLDEDITDAIEGSVTSTIESGRPGRGGHLGPAARDQVLEEYIPIRIDGASRPSSRSTATPPRSWPRSTRPARRPVRHPRAPPACWRSCCS